MKLIVKSNELTLITGAQKVYELMQQRNLTNIIPPKRPHGLRPANTNDKGFYAADCKDHCRESSDCHCICDGDCPDCSSDCGDIRGNDCGDCGGNW